MRLKPPSRAARRIPLTLWRSPRPRNLQYPLVVVLLGFVPSCKTSPSEPPAPPPLTLSIFEASAPAGDSLVVRAVTSRSASVVVRYGPGDTCDQPVQGRPDGRYVAGPVKKGEVSYTFCAEARAGAETASANLALRSARFPDACLDPLDKLEYAEGDLVYRRTDGRYSMTVGPIVGVIRCGAENRPFTPKLADAISADGGYTFRYRVRYPVGAAIGFQAAIYDHVKGAYERWLVGPEMEHRLLADSMRVVRPKTESAFTVPHTCGVDARCVDGKLWFLEVRRTDAGPQLIAP